MQALKPHPHISAMDFGLCPPKIGLLQDYNLKNACHLPPSGWLQELQNIATIALGNVEVIFMADVRNGMELEHDVLKGSYLDFIYKFGFWKVKLLAIFEVCHRSRLVSNQPPSPDLLDMVKNMQSADILS